MSYFKLFTKNYDPQPSKVLKIVTLNGTNIANLDEMYEALSDAFLFPDYFGKNFDALFDLMCDLDWVKQKKVELIIQNYADFLANESRETVLDVINLFNDVADEWDAVGEKSFKFFIEDCPTAQADLEELGFI